MQHKQMVKSYGFKSSKLNRTFDTYDHVDDWFYMNIHDILKQKKHGFSKITDHACREIRHKRISREDAKNLISFYSEMPPLYNKLFCDWLGVDIGSIDFILDSLAIRNLKEDIKKKNINTIDMEKIGFSANSSIKRSIGEKLINVGKGYP